MTTQNHTVNHTVAVNGCGCRVEFHDAPGGAQRDVWRYCDRHGAADAMLVAIDALMEVMRGIPHGQRLMPHEEEQVDHAMTLALEALAAADGGEAGDE
jgi:hypothetical protein